MQDDGRERRGLLQQLTPFLTEETAPVIQNIRDKEAQREEKEEERKERQREKRKEYLKKTKEEEEEEEEEMEDTEPTDAMQQSLDEDLSRPFPSPEDKMKEGKEEIEGDVGALSASGTYCPFLTQEELEKYHDDTSLTIIQKATAYINTLEGDLMSKTRQLVDANETISSFFQTQNLVSGGGSSSSSSSSSSFVPPKPPQHLSRGVDEAFEDQEDFALPEPFSKPPTSSNGTNFEDLYLQTQRKYDELVITCVTLTSELEDLKKTAEAVKLFNPSSASVSLPSLSPNRPSSPAPSSPSSLKESIDSSKGVDVFNDIAALLDDLNQKMSIQTNMSRKEAELASMFLEGLKNKKEAQRDKIVTQLEQITSDAEKLEKLIESMPTEDESSSSSSAFALIGKEGKKEKEPEEKKKRQREESSENVGGPSEMSVKRKRIVTQNMEELQQAYFTVKKQGESDENVLETFIRKHLQPCVIHTELSCLSVLRHRAASSSFLEGAVRAVSVDPNDDLCAVGGLSRAIQIFSLSQEKEKEADDEMDSGKKIGKVEFSSDFGDTTGEGGVEGPESTFLDVGACVTGLSWSPTKKNTLASVDARGHVMLWDVPTTSLISLCREHDPYPCTSVDFCPTEADIFATSSEDCTVRIWHLSQQKSTAQITVPSAVHSVRWNPVLESQLAFVCSDKIFTYDIRMIDTPIHTSPNYRRLSGMDWCRRDALVTQSLDNTMKMWDITKKGFSASPVRSYQGHQNNSERVGIACTADYIATGSENNSVYVYSTNFSNPSFTHTFNTNNPMEDEDAYVSSVGWNGKGDILVAGNSRGIVKVLSMKK